MDFSKSQFNANSLNFQALSGLFAETTTAYKFLFFIALLDLVKQRQDSQQRDFLLMNIVTKMLVLAWYPYFQHHLSFGKQDKITQKLDDIRQGLPNVDVVEVAGFPNRVESLVKSSDLKEISKYLKRYVPFRLIRPFLKSELENVDPDHGFDREIPRLAEEHFDTLKPIYRFDRPHPTQFAALILHPEWQVYLQSHYAILRSWAAWQWMQYMQARNPEVSAMADKLFPPTFS